MKPSSRLFVTAVILLLIGGMPGTAAQASSKAQEPAPTPAEEYVREKILTEGEADLAMAFEGEEQRVLPAAFIADLFKDPAFAEIPFFKLHNATIAGDLEVEGISIPFNVEFHDCTFNGRINLDSTEVRTFRIDNSHVTGSVRMGRLVVEGDLALYESTFEGDVSLFDASISNNLFARGSRFLGAIPDPNSAYPFELWKIQVGQSTEFTNAVIMGEAKVDDAKFEVDVRFDQASFAKPASFKNIWVGNLADFQGTTFKDTVTFESAIVERDASFSNAVFHGDADFNYFTSQRFMDFDGTTFNGKLLFTYTVIGWPYFENARFNNEVDFEGMQASNDFELTGAKYNHAEKPFTVYLAKVDGQVLFTDFTSPAGLDLTHNLFGTLQIVSKDNQAYKVISLSSTAVAGDLTLENLSTDELIAQGTSISESTSIQNVKVKTRLDMSNASLGIFNMSGFSWPNDPALFNLRGMTYNDIGIGNDELNASTWRILSNMVAQSAYSPESYRALAQFLTEKGHPEWAMDLEYERKQRERDEILTRPSGAWVWSWFLGIFSGYGQRPQFAFAWSALVILIGAFVFRREQDMVILDTSEAKPPYDAILYSFALFLPYIDLEIASKWDPRPERRFAGIYKHIHRLLGWILMPIALLTFGGIIG